MKLDLGVLQQLVELSLPTRERGLKLWRALTTAELAKSLTKRAPAESGYSVMDVVSSVGNLKVTPVR